jgi:NAD-reducing hydrogenase large subunit
MAELLIHLDEYGQVEDCFFTSQSSEALNDLSRPSLLGSAGIGSKALRYLSGKPSSGGGKSYRSNCGLDPKDLSPTATKLRRLMHFGQVFQSHALHFFYLASPDLLFGADAPVEKRNIVAVAMENREMALKGIAMRKFGQEIIKAVAGKRIHGILAVPGGVHKTFTKEERGVFFRRKKY